MKYSVIIPTYNHCDDLLRPCVQSVLTYSHMTEVELIISANGCVDNTFIYLQELSHAFKQIGMSHHVKIIWSDHPLGYAQANNRAIEQATGDLVVLLNNDCVLLPQHTSTWLHMLHEPFVQDPQVGISGVMKQWDPAADREFVVFFCVMIKRDVFDTVGLLNEDYQVGGCEDVEFCILAEQSGFKHVQCDSVIYNAQANLRVGAFPIYHASNKTLSDPACVDMSLDIMTQNRLKLAQKFNPDWYHAHKGDK